MVCPKCSTQCKQYKGIGAGESDVDFYDTAELKECPKCFAVYLEYYCTFELNGEAENHIGRLKHSIKELILKFLEKSSIK